MKQTQKTEYKIYYIDDVNNVSRSEALKLILNTPYDVIMITRVVRIIRDDGEELNYDETILYKKPYKKS